MGNLTMDKMQFMFVAMLIAVAYMAVWSIAVESIASAILTVGFFGVVLFFIYVELKRRGVL